MLARVLEPEVMDTHGDAIEYDSMDHAEVNRAFVADLLAAGLPDGEVLDVGTGTAQIPIELCRRAANVRVLGVDMAASMLELGRQNAERAGPDVASRIELAQADAKNLPYATGRFAAVVSNSIVHHLAEPLPALAEVVRVTAPGGLLFVRDLMRPQTDAAVSRLVDLYAADATPRQRQLFDDSLRAALDLAEIRGLVASLGFPSNSVKATSDRHWTWSVRVAVR